MASSLKQLPKDLPSKLKNRSSAHGSKQSICVPFHLRVLILNTPPALAFISIAHSIQGNNRVNSEYTLLVGFDRITFLVFVLCRHFCFPAQVVGGFPLNGLLEKVRTQSMAHVSRCMTRVLYLLSYHIIHCIIHTVIRAQPFSEWDLYDAALAQPCIIPCIITVSHNGRRGSR